MRTSALCAALFVLLGVSPAQETPQVAGMYSDMRHIATEDDYVGTEIFIVPSAGERVMEYHALVQFAEGVPTRPQLVDVAVDGTRIEFDAKFLGERDVHFVGEVTEGSLKGRFEGLDGEVELSRRASVWQ